VLATPTVQKSCNMQSLTVALRADSATRAADKRWVEETMETGSGTSSFVDGGELTTRGYREMDFIITIMQGRYVGVQRGSHGNG